MKTNTKGVRGGKREERESVCLRATKRESEDTKKEEKCVLLIKILCRLIQALIERKYSPLRHQLG